MGTQWDGERVSRPDQWPHPLICMNGWIYIRRFVCKEQHEMVEDYYRMDCSCTVRAFCNCCYKDFIWYDLIWFFLVPKCMELVDGLSSPCILGYASLASGWLSLYGTCWNGGILFCTNDIIWLWDIMGQFDTLGGWLETYKEFSLFMIPLRLVDLRQRD